MNVDSCLELTIEFVMLYIVNGVLYTGCPDNGVYTGNRLVVLLSKI